MSSGIQTVTKTHALCAVCFEWFTHDQLWVDNDGDKWDVCFHCGEKEYYMTDKSPIVTPEIAKSLVEQDGLNPSKADELVGLTMQEATAKLGQWVREHEEQF